MVHNNKILTVSYGTFSCTLEGFDDSFGTMQAIAEYFRDLAADDRYFGAEPAQPDADMLARIAQREVSRQVEAHNEKDGIVLRAKEIENAAPALATPAIPTEPVAPQVADPIAPVAPAVPEAAYHQPVEPTQPVAPPPAPVVSDVEEEPYDVETPVLHVLAEAPAPAPQPAEITPLSLDQDIADFYATPVDDGFTDAAPMAEPVDTPDIKPMADIEPATDSIAAKLQRIRAVVSQNEAAAQTADFTEDEHADAFMSSAVNDITEALQADDEAELTPVGEDAISRALDKFDEAAEAQDAAQAVSDAQPEPNDPFVLSEAISDLSLSDEADAALDAENREIFGDLDKSDLDDLKFDDSDDEEVINIMDDDEPNDTRVVKVKRSDLEAAIAAGELEEIEDGDEALASLSSDAEADLQRDLAEVESELMTELDTEVDLSGLSEDLAQPSPLPSASGDAEEDLSRLMAAAEEKMDEPETSSSRETYNQLRAAVAAAEADKTAGDSDPAQAGDDVYREDLASVVRPRRPVAGATSRPERPAGEAHPAPLKLVAEQRIDLDHDNRGPVRPRRVAASDVDATETASQPATEGGFADFAAEMGASSLPDLLEAAAAYMSFVEGRDQFSRPQLMNKVRQVETGDFNREDGLRSFGQLLRQGKIEKTSGGRFTASGEIGFRPDERAAG